MKLWSRLAKVIILLSLMAIIFQGVLAKEEPKELKNASVKIVDIIRNNSTYQGKMVVIDGKIKDECGGGHWFILDDGTAKLYVDVGRSNFIIPQKKGSDAKVYGKVTTEDNDLAMIGKIVEIDGEIYQQKKSQEE